MPIEKYVSTLILNLIDNQGVYDDMDANDLINEDELYFVKGVGSLPLVTTVNNGEFLRVVDGSWVSSAVPIAEEASF